MKAGIQVFIIWLFIMTVSAAIRAQREVTAYQEGHQIDLCCIKPYGGERREFTINEKDLQAVKNCHYIPVEKNRNKCVKFYMSPWAHHHDDGIRED